MAFAGRYVWWAAGLSAASLLIFLFSGPHTRTAGPGSSIQDIKDILSALGTIIGGIITILGIVERMRGGSSSEPKSPTSREAHREPRDREVAGRRRQEDDYDHRYERESRESYRGARDGEAVGRTRTRIVPDRHDDGYEWVETLEFLGYDEANNDEVWKIVKRTKQPAR